MIIEFPKKYSVRMFGGTGGGALVEIPAEYESATIKLFRRQPWISNTSLLTGTISVIISRAYDINAEQAHAALCQLCEHVMSPPVEVDKEVWGDALSGHKE